jgi:hypothetical protein
MQELDRPGRLEWSPLVLPTEEERLALCGT